MQLYLILQSGGPRFFVLFFLKRREKNPKKLWLRQHFQICSLISGGDFTVHNLCGERQGLLLERKATKGKSDSLGLCRLKAGKTVFDSCQAIAQLERAGQLYPI